MSIEPSAFVTKPGDVDDRLDHGVLRIRACVAPSYAVADQYWCTGTDARHGETISGATVEHVALAVFDRHQVELAGTKVFGAEVGDGVCHGAIVDGVAVGVGEIRHHSLDNLVGGGHVPMAAVKIGRREIRRLQPVPQPRMRLVCSEIEDPPRLVVRGERSSLFDADGFQPVDHRLVADQPRFGLHDGVESIEKPCVVGDRRIE